MCNVVCMYVYVFSSMSLINWRRNMEYNRENNYGCPQEIVESLKLYVEKRVPTGGFLEAVLKNDLCEALGRADKVNSRLLKSIVMYVYWEIPGNCWGSEEKVDAWLNSRDRKIPGEWITLRQRLDDAEGRAANAERKLSRMTELYKSVCTISDQRRVEIERLKNGK